MTAAMKSIRCLTALLFVVSASSALSQDLLAPDAACPAGQIRVDVPRPPAGFISSRSVWMGADCQPVFGPVEYQPKGGARPAGDVPARVGELETIEGVAGSDRDAEPGAASLASACFRGRYTLLDPINLVLNEVRGDVCWSWNGSAVTSYNVGGGWTAHAEYTPFGPGWTVPRSSNTQTGGCVGCSSASFKQFAEFAYRGVFDSSGTLYYNSISVNETVNGNGVKSCSFLFTYRTWSGLWHTTSQCS